MAKPIYKKHLFPPEFIRQNENYYRQIEEYDWVEVTDHPKGLESILHFLREKKTVFLIKKYGKGKKFLDAGCGTGLMLRHLPDGAVGLDINPRNLPKAKSHAPRAKLVLGKITRMPFSKNIFSSVICTEVLEHLTAPEEALAEIDRVLIPGGILIGSVPRKNWIWKLRFLSSTHPGEPYHKIYRQGEIKSLLKRKNWRILFLEHACCGMNFFFVLEKNG